MFAHKAKTDGQTLRLMAMLRLAIGRMVNACKHTYIHTYIYVHTTGIRFVTQAAKVH